jgi:hypothetical protein
MHSTDQFASAIVRTNAVPATELSVALAHAMYVCRSVQMEVLAAEQESVPALQAGPEAAVKHQSALKVVKMEGHALDQEDAGALEDMLEMIVQDLSALTPVSLEGHVSGLLCASAVLDALV